MAKRQSKMTPEEILQNHIKSDIRETEQKIKFTGTPTYKFNIGDKVKVGNLKDCVVDQILYDGRAYGIKCVSVDHNYGNPIEKDWYRVVSWVNVRPLNTETESIAQNQDIRLDFQHSTIGGLFTKYYSFGIDLSPEYQRDYVWELKDKVALIESIFNNIDIGKIVLVHKSYADYVQNGYSYEVLDGKQRIEALTAFYENRFPYKGKYYNDLSVMDRRIFKDHSVPVAIVEDADRKTLLRYFILLNKSGKVMDKEHLKKVEHMLEELEN